MRVALHSEIVEGRVASYALRHARVPDGLVETFARIGIHDWTIWRSGRRLFHLVDCDDWSAANAELDRDPANAAWQRDIGRFVEVFRATDGSEGYVPLDAVWSLATQNRGR